MKKIIVKYGLIGGAIVSVFMLGSWFYMQGNEPDFGIGQIMGYASMILALSTVFLGIKAYRSSYTAGSLTFKEAFTVGILITLLASFIYVTAWMVYYSLGGGQDMMADYFTTSVEKVKNSDLDPAKLETKLEQMESMQQMYAKPFFRAGMTFMEIFPVGFLITLISAFILKRK